MEKLQRLYVFHPSPNLVSTIDALLKKCAPDLEYKNIILPNLLDRAMAEGVTDAITSEIKETIDGIPNDPVPFILSTCSTLGGITEEIGNAQGRRTLRIDRPMAEEAVKAGTNIAVVAAVESTMVPTQMLLEEVAKNFGKSIKIERILCPEAWEYKQRGDDAGYIEESARCIDANAKSFDAVVLAQGSMADAKKKSKLSIPIFTSPELGVKRMIELMGVT